MTRVKVPHGWTRRKHGRKIVYSSEPPRVQIWSKTDFDKLKENGRFLAINREMLNFSSKVENELPVNTDADMEVAVDSILLAF